jgi:hypothetical protein
MTAGEDTMTLRTQWQTAKADAKKVNNRVEVKFPKNLRLGDALDKVEAAEKAYNKAGLGERNAAWAKTADAYFASAAAAKKIIQAYVAALPGMAINSQAKMELDSALSMKLLHQLNDIIKDGANMQAHLAKARLKKK